MDESTALVIIDMQMGFKPSPELTVSILKKVNEYKIVVATKFINGNALFQKVLKAHEQTPDDMKLIDLPDRVRIFEKTGYGVTDELIQYLKDQQVTRVHVCGLETDACVLGALYDFWDAEIQPVLLSELTSTKTPQFHQAADLIADRNFGEKAKNT
jgi:nicotinamidase-related amidase